MESFQMLHWCWTLVLQFHTTFMMRYSFQISIGFQLSYNTGWCVFLLWPNNMTWLHKLSWLLIKLIILTSQVQIHCDIPKQDPLRDLKLELLQQYFVPPIKEAKCLKYSVNSFTIKFALIPNLYLFLLNNLDDILWFFILLILGTGSGVFWLI
jgi:hypothetical protein